MKALVLVAALAAVPSLARAEVRLDGGQADHGVVVEAQLGTQVVALFTSGAGGSPALSPLELLQGGIFGGYKIKRFIFGLGFDVARTATGASVSGSSTTTSSATTSILFVPGLSVAILRSADKRVELFGQLDLGFGTTLGDSVMNGESIFRFTYDVGPGLRYWIHPQFAFGALAGVAGAFAWDKQSGMAGTPSTTTSSGLTSIFAQLQVMGVF
ncbi:MAG TPA: outer membrane beta-barrel protein [Polyangia bacterium]|nr:outer membrane beta-barrel protein [Polyangia bacterium]